MYIHVCACVLHIRSVIHVLFVFMLVSIAFMCVFHPVKLPVGLCVCICVAALITHVLDIHVHSELELASSLVPLTKKVEGLV